MFLTPSLEEQLVYSSHPSNKIDKIVTVQPDGKLPDDLRVHRNIAYSIEWYLDEHWVYAITTAHPFFYKRLLEVIKERDFGVLMGDQSPAPSFIKKTRKKHYASPPGMFFHSRLTAGNQVL